MRYALVLATAILSASAPVTGWAAAGCAEIITAVVVHANGNIYFSTNGTCSVTWCQAPGTGAVQQNSYAMLLSALITAQPVYFSWPNIPDCSTQNIEDAQPTYMVIK